VKPILPVIFGCAGPALSADERDFFKHANPFGFIVFGRNCQSPDQLYALTSDLRALSGRDDTPILIDQEGGRVARLRPPQWRKCPAAATFGRMYQTDPARAVEAARLNAALTGRELRQLGVNVDCAPLLDLRFPGASAVIGDRAYADDPKVVSILARAVCQGLMASGVAPVIKHLPGHGRAQVDSHLALPVVEAPRAELSATDFAPFRALADMPLGMSAHIVYTDLDPDNPATTSATVIDEVIRGEIGFDGLLLGDDISMQALDGAIERRALACVTAGCDAALHCNGELEEMRRISAHLPAMSGRGLKRWSRARAACAAAEDSAEDSAGGGDAALWDIVGEVLGGVFDVG
jgi:beta-N-acetylhexosaminidase